MKNEKAIMINMEPFIRCDQYNFIKVQTKNLVQAHSTVKDKDVLNALKFHSLDKVLTVFPDICENQITILEKLVEIEETTQAEKFLSNLKAYVIPFKQITEKTVKKLFPKSKKIQVPPLKDLDLKEISYLGWYDIRSERKHLIVDYNGNLMGIQGTFKSSVEGICALCNGFEEVGLFMSKVKSGKETYTTKGNYICKDSQKCNHNLITLDKLNDFIVQLKKN
jgi:Elongation factor G-binding protein, N-terminal/FBP C-terminal treble-clef zinc-finger